MIWGQKIGDLFLKYPAARQCFERYALPVTSEEMTLEEAVTAVSGRWLRDVGLTREELKERLLSVCREEETYPENEVIVNTITIEGGHNKSGAPERILVTLKRGETVCICGSTGSGKTRLLEDLEYIAAGDSPTGRKIWINGILPTEDERISLESRLCASLSQTMNFVLELTCTEFIRLHAGCRGINGNEMKLEQLCGQVMACANTLAGETFFPDTMITELSGGQSRALMIADIAWISDSPVVLIDEPENAGIDRDEILNLLASRGKLVLVSTHDPLIALSCSRRIVIQNGGIVEILERTEEEEELLGTLREQDQLLKNIRKSLRGGRHVYKEVSRGI